MSAFEIIDCAIVLDVPPEVATCPYCGARMTVSFSAWIEEDDMLFAASEIVADCVEQPEIGPGTPLDEWHEWEKAHSDMPYVYWLPISMKILAWVNSHYRFDVYGQPEVQP